MDLEQCKKAEPVKRASLEIWKYQTGHHLISKNQMQI